MMPRNCEICGAEHTQPYKTNACSDECFGLVGVKIEDEVEADFLENYAPARFQNDPIDPARIPSQSGLKAMFDRNHYDKPLKYISGPTGSGKTTTVTHWLGKQIRSRMPGWEKDFPVEMLTGMEFKDLIWGATMPDGDKTGPSIFNLMDRFKNASILVIDECDKIRFSEGVEDRFFAIIEYRERHCLTTILISPVTLGEFAKKLKRHGEQIKRRFNDYGVGIKFDLPPKLIKIQKPESSSSCNEHENENDDEHESKTTEPSRKP